MWKIVRLSTEILVNVLNVMCRKIFRLRTQMNDGIFYSRGFSRFKMFVSKNADGIIKQMTGAQRVEFSFTRINCF